MPRERGQDRPGDHRPEEGRKAIEEIFNVIHPAPSKSALKDIFTAESAGQFIKRVADLSSLLSTADSYDQVLKKLDAQIGRLEATRDEVLSQIYEKIRPIERSYRQLHCSSRTPKSGTASSGRRWSSSSSTPTPSRSQRRQQHHDRRGRRVRQVAERQLQLPPVHLQHGAAGLRGGQVRKRFEDIANQWGMLLIGDLKDDQSSSSCRPVPHRRRRLGVPQAAGRSAARTWSSPATSNSGTSTGSKNPTTTARAPTFRSGVDAVRRKLARTDRTTGGGIAQGPVGMIFGQIRGVDKARIEPRISQMEHLSMERQVVSIIRNEDNQLCFVGSRTQAEDPKGVLKFFTSYRVLRYLERRIAVYLRRVAEQRLTRDMVKEQVRTRSRSSSRTK